jgi:hypothetical protein
MEIALRCVMGNRRWRWSVKASFKERDLLLFSITLLYTSVYSLSSSFPSQLLGYFQSPFSDNTASLFFYCVYSTLTVVGLEWAKKCEDYHVESRGDDGKHSFPPPQKAPQKK